MEKAEKLDFSLTQPLPVSLMPRQILLVTSDSVNLLSLGCSFTTSFSPVLSDDSARFEVIVLLTRPY